MKKNEEWIHPSTWMNLIDTRLNQRSQTQNKMWQIHSTVTPSKSHPYTIPFFWLQMETVSYFQQIEYDKGDKMLLPWLGYGICHSNETSLS